MKIIERSIEEYQRDYFFSAIRNKVDYAQLLLYSARQILTGGLPRAEDANECSLKLIVGKMSRLFCYKDSKFFSVSFPFNVYLNGNETIEITTYSGENVDSHSISSAISVLNNQQFQLKPSPMAYLIQNDGDDLLGLYLLEEMFLFEPAYIRYDHDPKNHNGRLHPLYHLDINYSSYGTYKIGLDNAIINGRFEDILDTTTMCSFIV